MNDLFIEQANKFSLRERRQQQHESALCEVEGVKKPEEEEKAEEDKVTIEISMKFLNECVETS